MMAVGYLGLSRSVLSTQLYLSSAVFGIGMGLAGLGQNVGVSDISDDNLRRRMLSIMHSMYALAALTAPMCARAFMLAGWDWRSTFFVVGFLPAGIMVAGGWPRPVHKSSEAENLVHNILDVNSSRGAFIWFSVMVSSYIIAEIALATRLVLFVERTRSVTAAEASLFLAGFFFLFFVTRMAVGFVRLPWSDRKLLFVTLLSSIGVWILGLIHSPIWLALSGVTMGPFYPVAIAEAKRVFGGQSSRALSYVLGMGSLAIVGMHMAVGILTDQYGISTALWVGPAGLTLSFAVLFFMPQRMQ